MVETVSGSTYQQFVYRPDGSELSVYNGTTGSLLKGMIPLPGGDTAIYNASRLSYFRRKNWLGSSVAGTTWAHAIYDEESYAPFGETYNETTTTDRSFAGMDQDVVTGSGGTGVYDAYFRKYDPSAGRWLSPDPYGWGAVSQGNPQSLNRYAYALNNPMVFTDPMGLDGCGDPDMYAVSACDGDDGGEWGWGDGGDGLGGYGAYAATATRLVPCPDGSGDFCTSVNEPNPPTTYVPFDCMSDPVCAQNYILGAEGLQPPPFTGRTSATNNNGTGITWQGVKKAAKWYLCGSSPADNVKNWMIEGAVKGVVVGGITGAFTGTVVGTSVGGVAGAFLGGFIDGVMGASAGVLYGSVASGVCYAAGAY